MPSKHPFRLAALLVLCVAACAWLSGCTTPNITPPAYGASGATGDAEGGANGVDSYVLYTGPGSTGVLNPVRNEDRTSNAQTAPVFQLVLTPGSIADADPVAKELARRLNEATDDAVRDDLLAKLEARLDKLTAQNAGRFPSLTHAGLYVVNIQSNGESVQHLDATTAEAAAKGLAEAVKSSANATQ